MIQINKAFEEMQSIINSGEETYSDDIKREAIQEEVKRALKSLENYCKRQKTLCKKSAGLVGDIMEGLSRVKISYGEKIHYYCCLYLLKNLKQ